MLAINCRSTVRMCQAVLPGMLSRRRGAILNIGSAAATVLPCCIMPAARGAAGWTSPATSIDSCARARMLAAHSLARSCIAGRYTRHMQCTRLRFSRVQ